MLLQLLPHLSSILHLSHIPPLLLHRYCSRHSRYHSRCAHSFTDPARPLLRCPCCSRYSSQSCITRPAPPAPPTTSSPLRPLPPLPPLRLPLSLLLPPLLCPIRSLLRCTCYSPRCRSSAAFTPPLLLLPRCVCSSTPRSSTAPLPLLLPPLLLLPPIPLFHCAHSSADPARPLLRCSCCYRRSCRSCRYHRSCYPHHSCSSRRSRRSRSSAAPAAPGPRIYAVLVETFFASL